MISMPFKCQKVLFFKTNPVFGKFTTYDLLFTIPPVFTKVTFPCYIAYIGYVAVSMQKAQVVAEEIIFSVIPKKVIGCQK